MQIKWAIIVKRKKQLARSGVTFAKLLHQTKHLITNLIAVTASPKCEILNQSNPIGLELPDQH